MNIEYDNSKVEELFEDLDNVANSKNLLQKKIGKKMAIVAKTRKLQLKAAVSFEKYLQLGLGKPHSLKGNLKNLYGVDINAHIRLIVKPKTENLSAEALAECDTVIIKGIVEYHGKKSNDEWLIP